MFYKMSTMKSSFHRVTGEMLVMLPKQDSDAFLVFDGVFHNFF